MSNKYKYNLKCKKCGYDEKSNIEVYTKICPECNNKYLIPYPISNTKVKKLIKKFKISDDIQKELSKIASKSKITKYTTIIYFGYPFLLLCCEQMLKIMLQN